MSRRSKAAVWTLLIIYLAALLRITVFRSSFGQYELFTHGQIEWVPFVGLIQILHNSLRVFLYLFLGNLVWFVPLGLLLPMVTKCRHGVIYLGFLLSLYIEVNQYIFGTGVSQVEDLILNTAGTAMGYGIYCLWRAVRKR